MHGLISHAHVNAHALQIHMNGITKEVYLDVLR